ncbi:MAG: hypothetical protein WAN35_11665 [Terracidiphilus sp.]
MIRQAISCDICGTEKKQTNHWFVAYDQGGELRVSGWNSRNRLRPGSKHLCGQTCLHKLVDEFMARALTVRAPRVAALEVDDEFMEQAIAQDTSLTSSAAYQEIDSSARLIPTPVPVASARPMVPSTPVAPAAAAPVRSPLRMPMELVPPAPRPRIEELPVPVDEAPRYASRNWRAAAWERERERESRTVERRTGIAARRRFS